jgi:hypothetical protein
VGACGAVAIEADGLVGAIGREDDVGDLDAVERAAGHAGKQPATRGTKGVAPAEYIEKCNPVAVNASAPCGQVRNKISR